MVTPGWVFVVLLLGWVVGTAWGTKVASQRNHPQLRTDTSSQGWEKIS